MRIQTFLSYMYSPGLWALLNMHVHIPNKAGISILAVIHECFNHTSKKNAYLKFFKQRQESFHIWLIVLEVYKHQFQQFTLQKEKLGMTVKIFACVFVCSIGVSCCTQKYSIFTKVNGVSECLGFTVMLNHFSVM